MTIASDERRALRTGLDAPGALAAAGRMDAATTLPVVDGDIASLDHVFDLVRTRETIEAETRATGRRSAG